MTTVNIEAHKVVTAAEHALIDAKAEVTKLKMPYETNSNCWVKVYRDMEVIIANGKVQRLELLIVAAKACTGAVVMTLDDVGMIGEWLGSV